MDAGETRVYQALTRAFGPWMQRDEKIFARDDEPHGRPGMAALSALIRDRGGRAVAGLSISGLGLEPHLARNSTIARKLQRTAQQIGLSLA